MFWIQGQRWNDGAVRLENSPVVKWHYISSLKFHQRCHWAHTRLSQTTQFQWLYLWGGGGGWGGGRGGLCASMCACAHVRVHTCVCERLRSEQSSWTVLENWLHSLMVDFCAEWELKTNQLKCQCWSQPSGQLQTLTALTQCVPHTYFIIALPVKLMNPPALSKPAAPKPSWLICVASRRETWPVKILIITTSWKACALLFYLFIPLIIRGCSLLSVTFNLRALEAVVIF